MEKKLTKEESECYKMTEREFCEKLYNLDKDELNTKSNKVFVKNTIMANIIKHCRGEKKEDQGQWTDLEKNYLSQIMKFLWQ